MKQLVPCAVVFMWLALSGAVARAQDRGLAVEPAVALDAMRAEPRVALVIGNSGYRVGPLANPVRDARAMARALEGLGFQVTLQTDLDQRQTFRALGAFRRAIERSKGVALFYYAGHAVQARGVNYLVPPGAFQDLKSEEDLDGFAVPLERVFDTMRSAEARVRLVFLDACRNNPLPRGVRSAAQGLANQRAQGLLVAYATEPGRTADDGAGQHSPFTAALLEHLGQPGWKVEEVLKAVRSSVRQATRGAQTPTEVSALEGDFYFALPPTQPPVEREAPVLTACPAGTVFDAALGACVPRVTTDCPAGLRFEVGQGCVPVVAAAAPAPATSSGRRPRSEQAAKYAVPLTVLAERRHASSVLAERRHASSLVVAEPARHSAVEPARHDAVEPSRHVVAEPARAVVAPTATDAALPFRPGERWVGSYVCTQGQTELVVSIKAVEGTSVRAIFFFRHGPTQKAGRFWIEGRYDAASGAIAFAPGEWIERPSGYGSVGLDGRVTGGGRVLEGRVTSPGGRCKEFRVERQ